MPYKKKNTIDAEQGLHHLGQAGSLRQTPERGPRRRLERLRGASCASCIFSADPAHPHSIKQHKVLPAVYPIYAIYVEQHTILLATFGHAACIFAAVPTYPHSTKQHTLSLTV